MKSGRHRKIREIIENKNIETQTELASELRKQGLNVTQATVSRDIKEMGLVKISTGPNRSRYSLPTRLPMTNVFERLQRMFKDSVTNLDFSENLILIRTLPGTAHAVASCIDNLEWKEILGSVAGDDTILVVVKPKEAVGDLINRFEDLLK